MFHKTRKPLRHCAECGSTDAALGEKEMLDDGWRLHIMCGNCHTWRLICAPQSECEAWERDVLDPGQHSIIADINGLDIDRFKDEAALFIAALNHDLIGPGDFQ